MRLRSSSSRSQPQPPAGHGASAASKRRKVAATSPRKPVAKHQVPRAAVNSTNNSIVNNVSTPEDSVKAEAAPGTESSAFTLVQVHLLQPPDVEQVIQSTSSSTGSKKQDYVNAKVVPSSLSSASAPVQVHLLQPPDVEQVVQNTLSTTKCKKQRQVPTVPSDPPSASAVSPTEQFASTNMTGQLSAKPCPGQQPLPLAKKAAILADVRAGKLSKAEIVFKYHIRWAVLYEVIKTASEIDAALKHLVVTPEKRDSHLVAEARGFEGKPDASKVQESQEGISTTPGAFFMSEDLYFNPPKKRSRQPGSRHKKCLLSLDVQSASGASAETNIDSLSVAIPTTTTIKIGEAGHSERTNGSKPVARAMHTVSTQTVSSSGRGSLITFLSTTNGADGMTQVNHRRQADKGSGAATQHFQKLPAGLSTDGDCKGLLPLEFSRHFRKMDGSDDNATRVEDDTVCWPRAPPSPQPEFVTNSASSSAPAESSGFSLLNVKQEVEDSDTEQIVFDPLVVPKQEPRSPQGGDCDDFVMECDVDVEHNGEQNFQLLPHNVNNAMSQSEGVSVKCEPLSP